MKRSITIACALAIGSSLSWAKDHDEGTAPADHSSYQPEQMQLFDSSHIENKKVTDKDGKNLGKLERLLIDSKTGRVRFVVVQVDKEWSLNDPEVIIPWGTLQMSRLGDKEYALKIDATRDKLMNAPQFNKALVHQLSTRESGQPIYAYWGVTWQDESSSSTARSEGDVPFRPSPSTPIPFTLTPTVDLSSTPTSTAPGATNPASTGQSASTPATTTDGSVGKQPIGNTGTTDSPKPDDSQEQPIPNASKPVEPPVYEHTDQPDRTLGGDETD
jgi:sporulation protein YlmC with PRC-barrel domain